MNYEEDTISDVRTIYVVAIFMWILIIYILELYKTDTVGLLVLSIPIVFFIISMTFFDKCTKDIEDDICQYDILAFGVTIITVFLSWKYAEYLSYLYRLIFVGILLLAVSMLDLWIPKKELVLHKHIRDILQIMSTVIFIFIFYTFYFISLKKDSHIRNPFEDF